MPIKRVKQYSDRGNIKNLAIKNDESSPPTSFELRIKSLYENALATNNQFLIESIGLIPINSDIKNPIALYRHRAYVKELEAKLGNRIEKYKQEISQCFGSESKQMIASKDKQIMAHSIITQTEITKIAGVTPNLKRSFRRVV